MIMQKLVKIVYIKLLVSRSDVALAMCHRQQSCVTDNSGITTCVLMALEREMSFPPIPSRSVTHFTFFI